MSVTFVLLDDLTRDPIPEPIGWRQDAQVRKFYDVCQVLPPVIVMSCSPRLDDADAEQARTPYPVMPTVVLSVRQRPLVLPGL